jgi:hypothetical protein
VVTQSSSPSLLKIILAFAAIYIIWGSTYLGILLAIETIPPFIMVAVRFLTAGVILFLFSLAAKKPFPS